MNKPCNFTAFLSGRQFCVALAADESSKCVVHQRHDHVPSQHKDKFDDGWYLTPQERVDAWWRERLR